MNASLDRIVTNENILTKVRDWSLINNYLESSDGKFVVEEVGLVVLTKEAVRHELPLSQGIYEYQSTIDGEFGSEVYTFKIKDKTIRGTFSSERKSMSSGIFASYVYDFEKKEFVDFDCKAIRPGDISPRAIKIAYDVKKDVAMHCISIIFTQIFISEFRENKEIITESRVTHVNPNRKKDKNRVRKVVKIGIYHINPNFQAVIEKRKFERHAEAWGVRGHWRTIKKSGKRVWIKEYEKGKGEKEGKTYLV